MKHVLFTAYLVTLALAAPTYSQGLARCSPAGATISACMEGAWIGTSSALENIKAMLERMPPRNTSRQVFPDDFARALGIHIYPNGYYSTIPLDHTVDINDIHTAPRSGETTLIQTNMELNISSAFGWLWTSGNQMYFCDEPASSEAVLTMEVTSEGNTGTATMSPFGPSGFTPDIDFSCTGDSFNFTVHLPAPVGDVDYYFTRVPLESFEEEYLNLYYSRFAPAGGDGG